MARGQLESATRYGGETIEQIAIRTGLSRDTVSRQIRLGVPPSDIRLIGRGYGSHRRVDPAWDLPLAEHAVARAAISVAAEMDGLLISTIAEVMGVSRVTVEAIIRAGSAKIRARIKHADMEIV
jgi:DNA-binding transcriptional regulator LsrR (DeoR family)